MKEKPDHIKYNALKNAYYVPLGEILPCLRSCFFKEICPQYTYIYSNANINYAGRCAIEAAMFLNLHEYFSNTPEYAMLNKALLDEYISLTIAVERIRKQLSLNPEMVISNNKLTKPYEMLSRLQKKLIRAIEQLITNMKRNKGVCSNDEQKRKDL